MSVDNNHAEAPAGKAEALQVDARRIPERAHSQQHEREHEQDESEHGFTSCSLDAAREVVAMQFAAGRSVARLAEEWERDRSWVEDAIRQALLRTIPERDGGTKPPRAEVRAERIEELEEIRAAQGVLDL